LPRLGSVKGAGRALERGLGAVFFAVLLLWGSPAAAQSGFDGAFLYAGGAEERAAFGEAIERVVSRMNALIRSIARSRLRPRVVIAHQMRFRAVGDRLRIEHEPLPPREVRLDGAPMRLTNRSGDRVTASYRGGPGQITERIAQGRSSQTNRYLLSSDGRRLTVETRIRSPQLPDEIRFVLSYRRSN
jgi:hypothetical protein